MENLNEYGDRTASHYAAFRPPLHKTILQKCLFPDWNFDVGLDIGCGTGYSAVALKQYCQVVKGIEPSTDMLKRAVEYPGVEYLTGSGENIPVADQTADIITFAGSLFYANVELVAKEVRRVGKEKAIVVCYDFSMNLSSLLQKLGLPTEETVGDYNHRVNFSGEAGFSIRDIREETISIQLHAKEAMHVLLSHPTIFQECITRFPHQEAEKVIHENLQGTVHELPTELFYSVFQLQG